MVGNSGTYLDVPAHRFPDGPDVSMIPLEGIANLRAIVIRAAGRPSIEAGDVRSLDLEGKALLIHTGWSRHWGTETYFAGHPLSDDGP